MKNPLASLGEGTREQVLYSFHALQAVLTKMKVGIGGAEGEMRVTASPIL